MALRRLGSELMHAILLTKVMHEFYDVHNVQSMIITKRTLCSHRVKTTFIINPTYLGSLSAQYFSVMDVIMLQTTIFIESQNADEHCYYRVFVINSTGTMFSNQD